jgi:hypothetical protein
MLGSKGNEFLPRSQKRLANIIRQQKITKQSFSKKATANLLDAD